MIYDTVIFSTGMLAKSWEVVSFDLEALSPDLAKLSQVILVEGRRTNRASSEPLWASVAQTVYRWN